MVREWAASAIKNLYYHNIRMLGVKHKNILSVVKSLLMHYVLILVIVPIQYEN